MMFQSLRNRLILSHILPLLIILPLMGIGLIYVLETQVYLPTLAGELQSDAQFMGELTRSDRAIWAQPDRAREIVQRYQSRNNARMMLLDPSGTLLASSDPSDQERLGQVLTELDFTAIRSSAPEATQQIHYSPRQSAEVIDVIVPVMAENNQLLGFVRISYPFATLAEGIYQLRFLIFLMLTLGLLLGSAIGLILAVSVASPVREVTQAISALAKNSQVPLISKHGPQEIQLLSQSVNDLVTRLRDLEQARRQLLANLVHEIGRPLGAIRSAITALLGGADRDPVLYRDLLMGMDGETEQLQRLLNDLAGLHDQVLGTLALERQPIHLQVWLPEILRAWQAHAEEKGIRWELTTAANDPVVDADPFRLAQILGNLASNAIKFTPSGGTVSVSTTTAPGQMGIRIQDTGPGMNPEEQEKIFQPFYRGAHDRRFPQGMGLGLSIARDFTEAHGGHLSVESSAGGGSQFTVWLPARAA